MGQVWVYECGCMAVCYYTKHLFLFCLYTRFFIIRQYLSGRRRCRINNKLEYDDEYIMTSSSCCALATKRRKKRKDGEKNKSDTEFALTNHIHSLSFSLALSPIPIQCLFVRKFSLCLFSFIHYIYRTANNCRLCLRGWCEQHV